MPEFKIVGLPRGSAENRLANLPNSAVSEAEDYKCPSDRCGRAFAEPLKLTNLSRRPQEETYYACPHCFSRVKVNEVSFSHGGHDAKSHIEPSPIDLPSKERRIENVPSEGNEAVSDCPHQFGYLKSRSKNAEIPDRCFTCVRILQCMS